MTENNNKNKIYEIYNKIADWYDTHRSSELFEKPYLDMAISHIQPRTQILDLGCGSGVPIAQYFIQKGFEVTGIDGSQKQIAFAKSHVPAMKSSVADMREINLGKKYDCIIAWHSFFHLTQDDQRQMFKTFEKHIKPGGILLFTSGPDAGEVWSENGGENLYHASLSAKEYRELLAKHHFEVLAHTVEDKNCGDATVWLSKYQVMGSKMKALKFN